MFAGLGVCVSAGVDDGFAVDFAVAAAAEVGAVVLRAEAGRVDSARAGRVSAARVAPGVRVGVGVDLDWFGGGLLSSQYPPAATSMAASANPKATAMRGYAAFGGGGTSFVESERAALFDATAAVGRGPAAGAGGVSPWLR